MADYGGGGDYGVRRRPRPTPSSSSGRNRNNSNAAAAAGGVGQPRIVYRGRVGNASHANESGRSHPWDGRTGTGGADKAAYGGGGDYGRRSRSSRSKSRGPRDDAAGMTKKEEEDRKLKAIRSAAKASPDGLASAGIQLSDRQRAMMERRRAGTGPTSRSAAAAGATSGADGKDHPLPPKSKSRPRARNKSRSPMRHSSAKDAARRSPMRRPASSSANASRRGLAEANGTSPVRANNTSAATPPRPPQRRASSRRAALGDLDGNSPRRDSVGGGESVGGGGIDGGRRSISKGGSTSPKRNSLSKSPKRRGSVSKSPKRRSGSSSSSLHAGLNAAAAAASSSTSASTLVVHDDSTAAATKMTQRRQKQQKASAVLPPVTEKVEEPPATSVSASVLPPKKAPENVPAPVVSAAVPAPRGILRRKPAYPKATNAGNLVVPPSSALATSDVATEPMEGPSLPSVVAKSVPPLVLSSGDNATEDDAEAEADEDADYNEFVEELKEEVAPDHAQVSIFPIELSLIAPQIFLLLF